jgi:Mg-chelatase subunit ChlD
MTWVHAGLWLLPLLAVLGVWSTRRGELRRQQLIEWSGVQARRRSSWTRLCQVAGWGGLLLAILSSVQESAELEPRTGAVLVLLDVSRSMEAVDAQETRLQRLRRATRNYVAASRARRVALLVFAGSTEVVCPWTEDREVVQHFVATVGPEQVLEGGTDLSGALRTALDWSSDQGGRRLLVASDGDPPLADWQALTEIASRQDVCIDSLVYGGTQPARVPSLEEPITVADPEWTRAQPDALAQLSGRTGGRSWQAEDLAEARPSTEFRANPVQAQLWLVLGCLLLGVGWIQQERGR